jgi:hypothetical protein
MASATMDQLVETTTLKDSPVSITGTCDSCGTKAAHIATKDKLKLSFCGHHARHNAASLIERGFSIIPNTYKFEK